MGLHKLTLAAGASALVLALLAATGTTATAADLSQRMGPAAATSPWQIRLRGLGVITEDRGYVAQIPGSGLEYSDTVVPELDISYFFTDNIAAELILGTTKANIVGTGAAAGVGKAGETWLLPPTVTLQYHFTDFGAFKPYVGAGVNYTLFFSQKPAGVFTDIKVKDSFGAALQVAL